MLVVRRAFKQHTPKTFRALRQRLGFTAEKMARLCGASSGRVVRKWEAGDNGIPEGVSRLLWLIEILPLSVRTRVIDALMEDA